MNVKPDTKPRVSMQFKVGKRFAKTFKAIIRFKRTPSHDTPVLEPQSPLFFDIVAPPLPVTEPTSPRSRSTSDSLESNESVRVAKIKAIGGDIGSVTGSSGEESLTYSRSTASISVGTSGGGSHGFASASDNSETKDISESFNGIHLDTTATVVERIVTQDSHIPTMEDSRLSADDLSNPPAVYTEPPVPNPFLEDESEGVLPEESDSIATTIRGFDPQRPIPPTDEIPLTRTLASPVLSANINKAVPPPPISSDSEDEDEPPELSLHGLLAPTMFLPIPNVRLLPISFHLIWWLRRF
jgi:hypothetical protein